MRKLHSSIAAIALLTWLLITGLPALAQQKLSQQLIDHYVTLQTTKGPIIIRVFFSAVPYTASNFLNLVSRKFYDGLTFHRVENWVVQGGDPEGNGTGNYIDPDTGKPRFLKLEVDRRLTHNTPGVVAMARSQDPNSASCQFYILKRAMPQLNGQYAVFGHVVRGMQTVENLEIGDRIISARITDPRPAAEPGASGAGGEQSNNGQANSPAGGTGSQAPAGKRDGDSGF